MKNFLAVIVALSGTFCYADGVWVPLNQPQLVQPNTIVVQVNQQPVPVIQYQWVPHVVVQPIVVERRYVFRTVEEVRMVPVTQWVYQPTVVYK